MSEKSSQLRGSGLDMRKPARLYVIRDKHVPLDEAEASRLRGRALDILGEGDFPRLRGSLAEAALKSSESSPQLAARFRNRDSGEYELVEIVPDESGKRGGDGLARLRSVENDSTVNIRENRLYNPEGPWAEA